MQKILSGSIQFPLCLAPMVGLSHVSLRRTSREFLPTGVKTLWPTEMLNSKKIPIEDLSKVPETLRDPDETELIPQILGNEEKSIRESIIKLEKWGAAGIDINMGCPVQKALKHNYGVSLMGDPVYAAEVVAMATRAASTPVSVKLRAVAAENREDFLIQFVRGIQKAGAAWICLHPRTAEQKRRGRADWSQIRFLKSQIDIPVIGNGDIQISQDVLQMQKETGCDLVMSGRGLAARPWMLWQVAEDLGLTDSQPRSEWAQSVGVRELAGDISGWRAPRTAEEEGRAYGLHLLRFMDECERDFGPDLALRKIRFYVRMTSVWLFFGQSLISISTKSKNLSEMKAGVLEMFASPQEMVARTELRQ